MTREVSIDFFSSDPCLALDLSIVVFVAIVFKLRLWLAKTIDCFAKYAHLIG